MSELEFRRDLYRGTAPYYDRFRVPYPQDLIDDLARRAGADGAGRLLDLACGTGQVGLNLDGRFAEVWAVDQEPDMIRCTREKAAAAGVGHVRFLVSAAEDLSAPEDSFDLVTIGNAFHRLPRERVAASAGRWLRPGGWLALLWGGSPWDGRQPWQQAMSAVMRRWRTRDGVQDRVPAEYDRVRRDRPDQVILREAGFQPGGRYTFLTAHEWTPDTLVGFIYSTSVLSRAALGGDAERFEDHLRRELDAAAPGGRFPQTIDFAYDLARRPP